MLAKKVKCTECVVVTLECFNWEIFYLPCDAKNKEVNYNVCKCVFTDNCFCLQGSYFSDQIPI